MAQPRISFSQSLLAIVVIAVIGILAYTFLTAPDQRSWSDKVGDAFHALPHGVGKASEQLEDRTPGQKLGDDVKDAGQKIKDNTGEQ